MDSILRLTGILTLVAISGSIGFSNAEKRTSSKLLDAAYADGYHQILTAGLSQNCKENALVDLAAARVADAKMTCTGWVENVEDIGDIIGTAWDSFAQLVTDVNTVVNTVPECFSDIHWYNTPGKIFCVLGHFTDALVAVNDFWNYKNYVMNTVYVVEQYVNCLKSKKVTVSRNVQMIVETAKLCR